MRIRADEDIERHVVAELFCCPDCDETDIAVKVRDGVVMLSGFVPDFFHKYGAEQAVTRVPGVVAVANDIQVFSGAAYERTDPQIARASLAAIRKALPESWECVRPVVREACVTLEGELDSKQQRDLIGRIVRSLEGVAGVVNAIAVQSPEHLAAGAATTAALPDKEPRVQALQG